MRVSRILMLVAAGCFAAGSLVAAQGRGQGPPAGRGPAPQASKGAPPGAGAGAARGGGSGAARGNTGVAPGNPGGARGNTGAAPGRSGDAGSNAGGIGRGGPGEGRGNVGGPTPPGNSGDGRGNAGGVGRGGLGEGRGNAGNAPGDGRGNAGGIGRGGPGDGRGNAGGDDTPQQAGRGRGQNGDWVANLNPQLRARLEAMLPGGMSLEQAADGFRNQGQFIAALQQSNNHDLSFVDLKAEMTGDNPLSLGQALQKLGVSSDED